MKKRYDHEPSIEELAALPDSQIDTGDIPELDETFWNNARLVLPDPTRSVTLRVRQSVLDAYKAQGKGYQTRMNVVLETYAKAKLKRG